MCDAPECREIGEWVLSEAPPAAPISIVDAPAHFCATHLVELVRRTLSAY